MTLPYYCEQADSVLPKLDSSLPMIALAFTITAGSAAVKKVINSDTGEEEPLVLLNTEHIQSLYPKGRLTLKEVHREQCISYMFLSKVLPGCPLKESDVCMYYQCTVAYGISSSCSYCLGQNLEFQENLIPHNFPIYHTQ